MSFWGTIGDDITASWKLSPYEHSEERCLSSVSVCRMKDLEKGNFLSVKKVLRTLSGRN